MSTAVLEHRSITGIAPRRRFARFPEDPRPAPDKRVRLRLTPRGRAVMAGVIVVPVALAWAVLSWGGGTATATATDVASSTGFDYVQVESGQSLWQVAAAIAPEADPRDVVSDIVHLNGLQSSDVQPGQRLAVPEIYAD